MQRTRREFLHDVAMVSISVVGTGCVLAPYESEAVEPNPQWEDRAAELERNGVFSKADEGPWPGKADPHVPVLTFQSDGTVKLSTTHPMDPEHYVTAHYLRDQDGIVIGFIAYEPGQTPEAVFELPASTTAVVAYQHCNLHDAWEDDERQAAALEKD